MLEIGDDAERWAAKVRNPPTLVDKLGVKKGARVTVLGVDDAALVDALRGLGAAVTVRRLQRGRDVVDRRNEPTHGPPALRAPA